MFARERFVVQCIYYSLASQHLVWRKYTLRTCVDKFPSKREEDKFFFFTLKDFDWLSDVLSGILIRKTTVQVDCESSLLDPY